MPEQGLAALWRSWEEQDSVCLNKGSLHYGGAGREQDSVCLNKGSLHYGGAGRNKIVCA